MKLFTKQIKENTPAIMAMDGLPADQVKIAFKLFTPDGAATWYITEANFETGEAFGLCDLGFGSPELGYVDLNELQAVRGAFGMKVERDLHYDGTLADAMLSLSMARATA
tara:strand:- start:27 stop:356 length:330 start_codon:yes stop_codon:yes gene_type:complete